MTHEPSATVSLTKPCRVSLSVLATGAATISPCRWAAPATAVLPAGPLPARSRLRSCLLASLPPGFVCFHYPRQQFPIPHSERFTDATHLCQAVFCASAYLACQLAAGYALEISSRGIDSHYPASAAPAWKIPLLCLSSRKRTRRTRGT